MMAAGQRWCSTSEPELGLGLLLELDPSSVQILFPGSGEIRRYARDSAPLKRVRYQVGDQIKNQEGTSLTVESVEEDGGVLTYHGNGQSIREPELADQLTGQGVRERFLAGILDEPDAFSLRLDTWHWQNQWLRNPARGFVGGRVDLIPHQIAVAHELSQRLLPRALLADEVGLGKTIEACLVLHHGVVTGRIHRALIVVPDALVHQWFVELRRRFQLTPAIYDRERCEGASDNAFLDEQLVLCPMSLLTSSAAIAGQAVQADWDLLIVDEAHHLQEASLQVVSLLAAAVPRLLLLTATPEQMGEESHFQQLQLLDAARYDSLEKFQEEQAGYTAAARRGEGLRAAGDFDALRTLLEEHGPGRVVFRNTREQIKGFPKRFPHPVILDASLGERGRVQWLIGLMTERDDAKFLVMTKTPSQARGLAESIKETWDEGIVVFHEEQTLLERDRQAAWFAEEDGARLMIASDIGGEGRNFQFVQHLVLFDLPGDPERVEQRVGRLDRIGQQGDIHIHIPVLAGSKDAGVLRWLHEGLDAFSRPLQCGRRCYELFVERLDDVDDKLIKETRAAKKKLEAEVRQGRNRLIQWKHELAEDLGTELKALRAADADRGLLPFTIRLWDRFGLEVEPLTQQDFLAKAGNFYQGDLPIREEGFRFTHQRSRALEREDMDLLTADHPMVRAGVEALLAREEGTCTCVSSEEVDNPQLLFVFVLEAMDAVDGQVARFLPPTAMEFSMTPAGETEAVPLKGAQPADPGALLEKEAFRVDWFGASLDEAEALAEEEAAERRERALNRATSLLDQELSRLKKLAAKNDHVRPEEVEALAKHREAVLKSIQAAEPRLDMVALVLPG